MTEEENRTRTPEAANAAANHAQEQNAAPDLGKFQSVEALMRAYRELEAEFTRRSQRLKALEAGAPQGGNAQAGQAERAPDNTDGEALLRAVRGNEEVRGRIVGEYLASLGGVPLMAGTGAGVTSPVQRATSLRQAGALALGYFRHQKNGGNT